MMSLVGLIGIFVLFLSAFYIYYKYVLFKFWRKRGVPYIEPIVPTGNATAFVMGKQSAGQLFYEAYIKHKEHRVFGIYLFFKPNLIINDLDLIREVLTKEFGNFHDRGIFFNERTDPLSAHLFFVAGKRWRNLRVKMTPTFTSAKMKQMFSILSECAEQLANSLESHAQIRGCIDIKDIFTRFTTDIIVSLVFGIRTNCIEQPDNEFHHLGHKVCQGKSLWILLSMLAPQIMNFFSIPLTDQCVSKFFKTVFENIVRHRRSNDIVEHDFMNMLMQLMEKGHLDDKGDITDGSPTVANKFTMLEAAAQAYGFFVGGYETSAVTAAFCLYELSMQQDIQDKVRKEIDETLEKYGQLTYNAVNEMTYLHKVINETMRKYPPLPMLNRMCTKETNLPTTDIHLPKGTLITIPVFGLHRDPSIYPNPDKFDPERFNSDVVATRHPYAYLPFGEGPRNCIGARLAYMQMKIGISSLLSKFKFKVHPRTPAMFSFNGAAISLTIENDIFLVIEPR